MASDPLVGPSNQRPGFEYHYFITGDLGFVLNSLLIFCIKVVKRQFLVWSRICCVSSEARIEATIMCQGKPLSLSTQRYNLSCMISWLRTSVIVDINSWFSLFAKGNSNVLDCMMKWWYWPVGNLHFSSNTWIEFSLKFVIVVTKLQCTLLCDQMIQYHYIAMASKMKNPM